MENIFRIVPREPFTNRKRVCNQDQRNRDKMRIRTAPRGRQMWPRRKPPKRIGVQAVAKNRNHRRIRKVRTTDVVCPNLLKAATVRIRPASPNRRKNVLLLLNKCYNLKNESPVSRTHPLNPFVLGFFGCSLPGPGTGTCAPPDSHLWHSRCSCRL